MKKINCFVLYSNYAESIAICLSGLLEKKGFNPDVITMDDLRKFIEIPEGKDIYFIHLHDLERKDRERLKRLQEQQPNSYFVKLGYNGGGLFKGKERINNEEQLIFEHEIDGVLKEYIKNMK